LTTSRLRPSSSSPRSTRDVVRHKLSRPRKGPPLSGIRTSADSGLAPATRFRSCASYVIPVLRQLGAAANAAAFRDFARPESAPQRIPVLRQVHRVEGCRRR
jgi:hypothetical protein